MEGKWRTVSLPSSSVPQLLVKGRQDDSGYTILLTDLSRIWGETLTKRDIKRRALTEDCSIDPSDGDDQYHILIEKIEQGLSQRAGASINLRTSAENNNGLVLNISAPLPEPLPEFSWKARLALLPSQHVRSELIGPLLHQVQRQQSQIQGLIRELHDKDRVISKITDRLEQSGNDLTVIFPGIPNTKNRKKSAPQREQLAKHVKGFDAFDESEWRARYENTDEKLPLEHQNLDSIMCSLSAAGQGEVSAFGNDAWWEGLDGGTFDPVEARKASEASQKSHHSPPLSNKGDGVAHRNAMRGNDNVALQSADQHDSEEDDDETQELETLSRIKDRNSTQPIQKDDGHIEPAVTPKRGALSPDHESTEGEDDLTAPSWKPPSPRQSTATSSPRRLGMVGGKRRAPSPAKESSPLPPKAQPKLGRIGGKAHKTATPEPTPEESVPPARSRSKIGTIGGKRPEQLRSPTSDSQPLEPATRSHKLGVIGGTRAPPELVKEKAPSDRQTRSLERKDSPPAREASQERADRKRVELKRQLEDRAKAPMKKKRKF